MMKCFKTARYFSTKTKHKSVCIVGAGPAGFYAAMHLTKNLPDVCIDIVEKMPVPFGLIRYGVAPDHQEVKNVINQFTKVAQKPNVNFYGNISLGTDVKLSELRQYYDAVLLTYGAGEDKLFGIKNEDAHNFVAARKFVGWYSGLPYATDIKVDLSVATAAVLGQGNVALDVARVLLTPIDELRKTDVPEHVLATLATSRVKELYLVGRRGPLNVAFTIKELREQLKMKNCRTIWRKSDFEGVQEAVSKLERPRKRLTELMLKSVGEMSDTPLGDSEKCFKPIFFRSPDEILVDEQKRLTGIKLIHNKMVGDSLENQKLVPTDQTEILNCSLAFRSIGYKSIKVDDSIKIQNGVLPNDRGKVEDNTDLAKLYVAGWLGTGPTGVILHTMGNAFQVAKLIIEDLSKSDPKGGCGVIRTLMKDKPIVDWQGWEKIDQYELQEGKKLGKPREKICDVQKMIEIANL